MRYVKCPTCRKRFYSTRLGTKNLNFHIQEKHPETYPYKIKPMFESLVEELNSEKFTNNTLLRVK